MNAARLVATVECTEPAAIAACTLVTAAKPLQAPQFQCSGDNLPQYMQTAHDIAVSMLYPNIHAKSLKRSLKRIVCSMTVAAGVDPAFPAEAAGQP